MTDEPTPDWNDIRSLAAGAKEALLRRLGDRLRRARRQAGLTQFQAAQVVDVTPQTIRNWETGRNEPPAWTIGKLAEAYKTSENELLRDLNTPFELPPPGLRFPYDRVFVDARKLSQARKDSGLTQQDVAYKTSVSVSAIRRYERGISNPTTRTLQNLADIYGKQAGWFTARGHFTEEERQRFEASTTWIPPADYRSDLVTDGYDQIRDDLPEDAKEQILEFMLSIHQRVMSGRGYRS